MLKFIKYSGLTIPVTPAEIKDINHMLPYVNTVGIVMHQDNVTVTKASDNMFILDLKGRLLNNVVRISNLRLQELLAAEPQFLPNGYFILQTKDMQGIDVSITPSKKIPSGIRIQCEYFIMDGGLEFYKTLLELIQTALSTKDSILNILQSEVFFRVKKEYESSFQPSFKKVLNINVTRIRQVKKRGDKSNEIKYKLYFQIVTQYKVLYGFSEDNATKIMSLIQIII